MKGLYDQLVEMHRDKTQPPFRCRSCGGEDFKEWEPIWCSNRITIEGYDETDGFSLDYDGSDLGDGGDFLPEFWCVNCDDTARSLEELVGLPAPDWAKPQFSWTGWESECEPPEPGKEWITIECEGEEYATIVLRTDAFAVTETGQENLAIERRVREARAQAIVDALNR